MAPEERNLRGSSFCRVRLLLFFRPPPRQRLERWLVSPFAINGFRYFEAERAVRHPHPVLGGRNVLDAASAPQLHRAPILTLRL